MPDLPAFPDLNQLRHRAKDLLRAAKSGDREAVARVASVSDRLILASAQLTVAREHGFGSWSRLKAEVQRREILDSGDVDRLVILLAEHPQLSGDQMEHWCDHPKGASPLGYVAMLRFDARRRGSSPKALGTGRMARALLDAGAPVDGDAADSEAPLITAASYGDAEVARILIDAGADLEAVGPATGGTALHHAAVFGMTDVIDVLVAAGARVDDIAVAAAAGDVTGWLRVDTPVQDRIRALVMAADHERLDVIDQLIESGTPVDAADAKWGRQALRIAAQNGRPASVRRLLFHGADPNVRDAERQRTALDWCREQSTQIGESSAHDQVEAILDP